MILGMLLAEEVFLKIMCVCLLMRVRALKFLKLVYFVLWVWIFYLDVCLCPCMCLVLMEARRECHSLDPEIHTVVSWHVGAGNGTQVLLKNSHVLLLLCHFSSPLCCNLGKVAPERKTRCDRAHVERFFFLFFF